MCVESVEVQTENVKQNHRDFLELMWKEAFLAVCKEEDRGVNHALELTKPPDFINYHPQSFNMKWV